MTVNANTSSRVSRSLKVTRRGVVRRRRAVNDTRSSLVFSNGTFREVHAREDLALILLRSSSIRRALDSRVCIHVKKKTCPQSRARRFTTTWVGRKVCPLPDLSNFSKRTDERLGRSSPRLVVTRWCAQRHVVRKLRPVFDHRSSISRRPHYTRTNS